MLGENVFRERVESVVKYMDEKGATHVVLTPSPNFHYLTGLPIVMRERLVALVISRDAEVTIIAPSFEVSEHARHTWVSDIVPWEEDEDPFAVLAERLGNNPRVLFDEGLPLGVFWKIERAVGGFESVGLVTPRLRELRMHKTADELALMRRAGRVISDAVASAFESVEAGMTELDVQQVVNREVICGGATPTFAAVQFGEDSALPHAAPGNRVVQKGDVVLMDCGCAVAGYNTDMTRMGVVGDPSDELEKIYSVVLAAQEVTLDQLKPGIACGAADGIARRAIEEAGYGHYFTHRLGHGIGMEVHEPPYLVRGNSARLEPGMTHSVEPGIYLKGVFGVRIEDLVHITEDGAEVITYAPKDLFQLEI